MGTDGSRKLCYHQIIVGGATRNELQQTVCALVNFGQAEVVQWACWLAGRPARLTPDHFGLFTHSKSATKGPIKITFTPRIQNLHCKLHKWG